MWKKLKSKVYFGERKGRALTIYTTKNIITIIHFERRGKRKFKRLSSLPKVHRQVEDPEL